MRKLLLLFLIIPILLLSSCEKKGDEENGPIVVTALNFPSYDAARAILGEGSDLRMLIPPGSDIHSYEPSPDDVIRILNSDIFIYTGGESDEWVERILNDVSDKTHIFSLMEHSLFVFNEETVEGMEEEESDHDHEMKRETHIGSVDTSYDEHVWTSLENMASIINDLSDLVCEIDPDNAERYRENSEMYISEILKIKDEFERVTSSGKRTLIIVADRFPFLYFAREMGLSYYAAFPGCSSATEPSARTVAFLIDKVKEENIPIVFHTELSNTMLSELISEETGAESAELNSAQNISQRDFNRGLTYIDIMRNNLEVIGRALN